MAALIKPGQNVWGAPKAHEDAVQKTLMILPQQNSLPSPHLSFSEDKLTSGEKVSCDPKISLNSMISKPKENQRETFFREGMYLENQKATDTQMVASLMSSHWSLSSYLKLDESLSSMDSCTTSELNDIKTNGVHLEGTATEFEKKFLSAQKSNEYRMKLGISPQQDSLPSPQISSSPMPSCSSDLVSSENTRKRRTSTHPSANNTFSWRSWIAREEQKDPLFEEKLRQEAQKAIDSHSVAMLMSSSWNQSPYSSLDDILSSVDGFTPTELRALYLNRAMTESAALIEQDKSYPGAKEVQRKPLPHFQQETDPSQDWRSMVVMEDPKEYLHEDKSDKNVDACEISKLKEARRNRNLVDVGSGDTPRTRDTPVDQDSVQMLNGVNAQGDGAQNTHSCFSNHQIMLSSSLHDSLPLPSWDNVSSEHKDRISPYLRKPICLTNWNTIKEQKNSIVEKRICQKTTDYHNDGGLKVPIRSMSPCICSGSFRGSSVRRNATTERNDIDLGKVHMNGKVVCICPEESRTDAQMTNDDALQNNLPRKPISFPELLSSPFHSNDLAEQDGVSTPSPLSMPMTWASWIAREAQRDPLFEERLCQGAQKAADAHGKVQESSMSLSPSPYVSSDDTLSSVDRFTPMELRMLGIDKCIAETQCNGGHKDDVSNVIDHRKCVSLHQQDNLLSSQSSQLSASPMPPQDLVSSEQERRISPDWTISNSISQNHWFSEEKQMDFAFDICQEAAKLEHVAESAELLSNSKITSPDVSLYDSLSNTGEVQSTVLESVKSFVQSVQKSNENVTENATAILPHTDPHSLFQWSCTPMPTWEQTTSDNERIISSQSTVSKTLNGTSWVGRHTNEESLFVEDSLEGQDVFVSTHRSSSPDDVLDRTVDTPTPIEQTGMDIEGTKLAESNSLITYLDGVKSHENIVQNEFLPQKDIYSSTQLSSSRTSALDNVSFAQDSFVSPKNTASWTIMFEKDPKKPRKRSSIDLPSEPTVSDIVNNGDCYNNPKATLNPPAMAGAPPTVMRSRIPVMARFITTEETKAQIDECVAKLKEFQFSLRSTPTIVVPMESPERNIPPLPPTMTNKQCGLVVGKTLRLSIAPNGAVKPQAIANPPGNCVNKPQHRKLGFFGNKCRLEKRGPKVGTLKGKRLPCSKPSDNRGTKGAAPKIVCKDKPRPFANPSEKMSLFFQYNSANDWTKKMEGFQIVQALAINHPYTLQLKLHGVCLALEQGVSNLRSAVAVKAIDTIAVLHLQMGKEMDCVAERIGRALLLTFSQTINKFIHERADHALDALVEHCSPEKTLSSLLNTGLDHRCATVRGSAAKHLHLLTSIIGEKYFLRPNNTLFVETFFKAVWKMSADAAQDVRHYGREMFQKLCQKEKFQELWKKIIPDKDLGLFNKLHCTI